MNSPFNWRNAPMTIDIKEQNAKAKWLIAVSKNPDAIKPQRTFTIKGKALAEQRKSK